MANICSFAMRVKGNKEDITMFYKALTQDGDIWMGRGADAQIDFEEDDYAAISGWCKWSIHAALVDNAISMRTEPDKWYHEPDEEEKEYITVFEACERWNITMEVYSEESGCSFQEHYICDKGDVVCEECVDWDEIWADEYETKAEAEEELGIKITDQEWEAVLETGYFERGGFENWDFEI